MTPRTLALAQILCFAFGVCGIFGCKASSKTPPPDPAGAHQGPHRANADTPPAAQERGGVSIEIDGKPYLHYRRDAGEREFKAKMVGSAQLAKIKIQQDRVKLKIEGQTVAKVKAKERGCKIYRGDEDMVMRVKSSGEHFQLLDGQNNEIGSLRNDGSGSIAGKEFRVETQGQQQIVQLAGQKVATVSGETKAIAAAFLALSSLRPEERVAAFIYAYEWL